MKKTTEFLLMTLLLSSLPLASAWAAGSGFHADLNTSLRIRTKGKWVRLANWRTKGTVGIYKLGNSFNESTGEFTVSKDGYYYFSANIRMHGARSGFFRLLLSVNGSTSLRGLNALRGDNPKEDYFTLNLAGTLFLKKGQKVSLLVFASADADYTIHTESGFTGHYIGSTTVGFTAMLKSSLRYRNRTNQYIALPSWQSSFTGGFNTGAFNPSSGTFIAPKAGYYAFATTTRFDNANGNYSRLILGINGKADPNNGMHTIDGRPYHKYHTMFTTGIVRLKKGDRINVYVYSHSDADYTIHPETSFSGYFLSNQQGIGFQVDKSRSVTYRSAYGLNKIGLWHIPPGGFARGLNISTGVFIAPVEGYYRFSSNLRFDGLSAALLRVFIRINSGQGGDYGMQTTRGQTDPTYFSLNLSGQVFLKKGDQVSLWMQAVRDVLFLVTHESGFSGYLIRATDADGDGVPYYANDCDDNDKTMYPAYKGKKAATEICDGKDNNCDGKVDETFEKKGKPCQVPNQKGPCAKSTYSACTKGALVCPQSVQSSKEICDGKDNDCDGSIDESYPQKGTACQVAGQKGECIKSTLTCTKGKITCPLTVKPAAETCDGKDNNCDGKVDETCECKPGAKRACFSGKSGCIKSGTGYTCKGICKAGMQVCSKAGKWGSCTGEVTPTTEVCDGKDNNCEGKIDESYPQKGKACKNTAQKGPCADSQYTCVQGKVSCPQTIQPTKEVCDGKDNDCDGSVDESFDQKGKSCKVPKQKGACASGQYICDKGALACPQTIQPGKEACNGKDDDCDGKVDNGASASCGAGKACTGGTCVVLPKEEPKQEPTPEIQEEPATETQEEPVAETGPEVDAGTEITELEDAAVESRPELETPEKHVQRENSENTHEKASVTDAKVLETGGTADAGTTHSDTGAPLPPSGCCSVGTTSPGEGLLWSLIGFFILLACARNRVSQ